MVFCRGVAQALEVPARRFQVAHLNERVRNAHAEIVQSVAPEAARDWSARGAEDFCAGFARELVVEADRASPVAEADGL